MNITHLGELVDKSLAQGDDVKIKVPFFGDFESIESLSEIPGGWLQFRCKGQSYCVWYVAIDKVEGLNFVKRDD